MRHQLTQHETVLGRELAIKGVKQFPAVGLEAVAGQHQHLGGRLAFDQRLDHRSPSDPMDVTDDDRQTNAAIGKHLVHAVLLAREDADQLLALPRHMAQLPQLRGRHERGTQQSGSRQRCQPLRIRPVGLATRNGLHMPGIDHRRHDADLLQRGIGAFPVDARALHDHDFRVTGGHPLGQRLPVPLEAAELGQLNRHVSRLILDNRTDRDLRLMHVQPNHALVERHQFHRGLLSHKMING